MSEDEPTTTLLLMLLVTRLGKACVELVLSDVLVARGVAGRIDVCFVFRVVDKDSVDAGMLDTSSPCPCEEAELVCPTLICDSEAPDVTIDDNVERWLLAELYGTNGQYQGHGLCCLGRHGPR